MASDDAVVEAANRAHWELLETEYRELSNLSGNEFTPEPWTGTEQQRDAVEPVSLVILTAVRKTIAAEVHALVLRFAGVYHADSPGAMADEIAVRIERGGEQ
jgi:hypothetical protein